MTYIAALDATAADSKTAATLDAVKARLGMVPNLYATLAKAPAALDALLAINALAALDDFRAAGLSESDLLEIAVNVAATTLTNYVNNLARTEIDFPVVKPQLAA